VKKNVTWVVVADHQHGRILYNDGPDRGLHPVDGMSFETPLPSNDELVTDRLPRSIDSTGDARHAIEARIDPRREAARRFVGKIAREVSTAARRGAFDRLIVVAPPRALGELRKALPHDVRDMMIGEIDRNLTTASMKKLQNDVAQFMAV
jgi:protein required for attachment to host cells